MNIRNPRLICFGIKDKETFQTASKYASGAIIGSQFVRIIGSAKDLKGDIVSYLKSLR
jgi:tryptophan synthase alpha chain